MELRFECPHCGQSISVAATHIGISAPCPHCAQLVTVPNPLSAVPATSTPPLEIPSALPPPVPIVSHRIATPQPASAPTDQQPAPPTVIPAKQSLWTRKFGDPFKSIKSRQDALTIVSWVTVVCWLAAGFSFWIVLGGAEDAIVNATLNATCALLLQWKKSRIAAIILLIWYGMALYSTLPEVFAARFSILAWIIVFQFVMAVQVVKATFKFHGIYASKRAKQ